MGHPSLKPLCQLYKENLSFFYSHNLFFFFNVNCISLIMYLVHQIWYQMILGCFPELESNNEHLPTLKLLQKGKWYRPWRQFQKRRHKGILSNGMSVLLPGVAFLFGTALVLKGKSSYLSLKSISSSYIDI